MSDSTKTSQREHVAAGWRSYGTSAAGWGTSSIQCRKCGSVLGYFSEREAYVPSLYDARAAELMEWHVRQ